MLQIFLYIIIVVLAIYVAWSYGLDNDNWFGRWVNSWLNTSQSKKYSLRDIDEAWVKLDETQANIKEYKNKISELDKSSSDYEENYKKYSEQIDLFHELERRYIAILDDAGIYKARIKIEAEEELPKIEQEIIAVAKEMADCEKLEKTSGSEEVRQKFQQLNEKLNELRARRCKVESIINEPEDDDDDFLD